MKTLKMDMILVFIARVAIKEADYKDIEKSMNHL